MDYKQIKHKIDIKFNKKLRYIINIICIIIACSIISPIFVQASSASNQTNNINFYTKLLNYTVPSMKFVNGCYSDYKMSLKEIIQQKFNDGYSLAQTLIDGELSMLNFSLKDKKNSNNTNISDDSKDSGQDNSSEEVSLNPFQLDENDISEIDNGDEKYQVYDPKLKKDLNLDKPEVLIYHTHTRESYRPGAASTIDQNVNICAAGDVLAEVLMNDYGICTIHDKTDHNAVYTKSYSRSRVTLQKYLKKYGDFKLIIDLHRDSVDNKNAVTLKINNKETARYMFVLDKSHQNYKNNLKVMNLLAGISDKLYPNLIRKTRIYEYPHGVKHFNQDLSNNCIVIELGSYMNTTTEAKSTAEYLARIIAEYINN